MVGPSHEMCLHVIVAVMAMKQGCIGATRSGRSKGTRNTFLTIAALNVTLAARVIALVVVAL